MLWYCRFTWNPGTTTDQVRHRVVQQHAAGTNHPEKIRGWYNLAGGGAGFMLVEADDPRELNEILEPYMSLVAWDVHAIYELPYNAVTAHLFPTEWETMSPESGQPRATEVGARYGDLLIPEEQRQVLDDIFTAAELHIRSI